VRQSWLETGSGDIATAADDLGLGDWPEDEAMWDKLAEASKVKVTESTVTAIGSLDIEIRMDMPSAVLLELVPSAL